MMSNKMVLPVAVTALSLSLVRSALAQTPDAGAEAPPASGSTATLPPAPEQNDAAAPAPTAPVEPVSSPEVREEEASSASATQTSPAPADAQAARPRQARPRPNHADTEPEDDSELAEVDDESDEEEEAPPETHAAIGIFFNVLGVVLDTYSGEVGLGVGRDVSLNLGGAYVSKDNVSSTSASAGFQVFTGDELYEGFFLYPAVAYATASAEDSNAHADAVGAGLLLGGQNTWGAFSLRYGGGIMAYTVTGESGGDSASINGARLLLDLSIGSVWRKSQPPHR
jgi:hypothetical protein